MLSLPGPGHGAHVVTGSPTLSSSLHPQDNSDVRFKVKRSTPMRKLIKADQGVLQEERGQRRLGPVPVWRPDQFQ